MIWIQMGGYTTLRTLVEGEKWPNTRLEVGTYDIYDFGYDVRAGGIGGDGITARRNNAALTKVRSDNGFRI